VSYDIEFWRTEPAEGLNDPNIYRPFKTSSTLSQQVVDLMEEPDVLALAEGYEISDATTGIQLRYTRDAVVIHISYGPKDDPDSVIQTAHAIAKIVEHETGLTGYDPQIEERTGATQRAVEAYRYGIEMTQQVATNS
jgi:hypothetical protein